MGWIRENAAFILFFILFIISLATACMVATLGMARQRSIRGIPAKVLLTRKNRKEATDAAEYTDCKGG